MTAHVTDLRRSHGGIALVPTMGALHAGHLALLDVARQACPAVAASIFVNPTQFAPHEDFTRYPREEDADLAKLRDAGCNLVWLPGVAEMYPPGDSTFIDTQGPALGWEGDVRPGHFRGVATVVAKLFGQVRPDAGVFGEKDWQQLQVIRRMAADLALPVQVIGAAIVREADGLAMSSRNRFLTQAERAAAPALYRRWDWRMPLSAIATMVLLYLPYSSVGSAVLGFMPGYVDEEGLRSGSGFFLWALLERAMPLPAEGIRYYLPFAVITMGALAAWVQFGRSRVSEDSSGVLGTYVLASAFVLLFSPHNAWYFAWLVPFLCFRFSIAHLWLTSVCVLIYTFPNPFGLDLHLLLYVPFMLLLILQYGFARHRANLARHLPERIDAEPVNRPSG